MRRVSAVAASDTVQDAAPGAHPAHRSIRRRWPLAARLAALGITTPLDLERVDPRLIRERLSVVKSIKSLRSFRRPASAPSEMREAVAAYTARAAEKLRRQRLATASLIVFVETNRFKADNTMIRRITRRSRCVCLWRQATAASRSAPCSPAWLRSGATAIATRRPVLCCSICIRPRRRRPGFSTRSRMRPRGPDAHARSAQPPLRIR